MPGFPEAAAALAEMGRRAHARGWALGTSGNFSAVVDGEPLRLAITRSGVDKGGLTPEQILEVDAAGALRDGSGRPSAETAIHLAVVRARGRGRLCTRTRCGPRSSRTSTPPTGAWPSRGTRCSRA